MLKQWVVKIAGQISSPFFHLYLKSREFRSDHLLIDLRAHKRAKKTPLKGRVATKISRNEIPRYFVLFLFRFFAKMLGKIPRNFAEFRFAKMFLFRHISRNSVDLVQIIWKKTCPSMGARKTLVSPAPPPPPPSAGGNARSPSGCMWQM